MADEEESSGDSTDVFSTKFDSLKALYEDRTKIPNPDAKVFDNLSKFESVVLHGNVIKPSEKEGGTGARRFLPHQEPISTKGSARQQIYSGKNVITKMQKFLGPLAVLYQYMENRTKVKVYTRSAAGVRGHIEAYIAAFDRHWNLALEDCIELWSRKTKRKAPALGEATNTKCRDNGPKVIVKNRTKTMETLERHVPQLLVRGEQVALIVKLDID